MITVTLILFCALTLFAHSATKHPLHPAVVYSAIWSVQILGVLMFEDRFLLVSDDALLVVALGGIAFVCGALLTPKPGNRQILFLERVAFRGVVVYTVFAAVAAFCIYQQYSIFSALVPGDDLATRLVFARTLLSVENEDIYGGYKYGNTVAFAGLVMLQLLILRKKAHAIQWVLFAFFLVASIASAILSTGRTPLALILMVMCVVYVWTRGLRWRSGLFIASSLAAIFLVFWVMGSAMGKADEEASRALDDLVDYLFSSIPALSAYLHKNGLEFFGGDGGENTFRFFTAIGATLGLNAKPPPLVQEFIPVPNLTNLYTVYFHYIKDFGLAGAIALPFLLGLAHGVIFDWARRRPQNDFATYVLAISFMPLLQTVFQETHLSNMSTWIQLFVFGLLFTRIKNQGTSTWRSKTASYPLS